MGFIPQPKGYFRILGEFRKGSHQTVSRIQGRGRGERIRPGTNYQNLCSMTLGKPFSLRGASDSPCAQLDKNIPHPHRLSGGLMRFFQVNPSVWSLVGSKHLVNSSLPALLLWLVCDGCRVGDAACSVLPLDVELVSSRGIPGR